MTEVTARSSEDVHLFVLKINGTHGKLVISLAKAVCPAPHQPKHIKIMSLMISERQHPEVDIIASRLFR